MFFNRSDYAIRITGVYHIVRSRSDYATLPRKVCVLSYRLQGQADITQERTVIHADPEHVLFFPSEIAYRQRTESEEIIAVHMEIPGLQEHRIEALRLPDATLAAKCFPELRQAWENGQYYRCCALLYGFLHEICVPRYADGSPRADELLLAPALNQMRTAYGDPKLSISDLAACCGLSPGYFRRVFFRAYSMTPLRYLTRIRIAKAKSQLLSGCSVVETAACCGFSDAKYFSTVFRRFVGCAPSEWKQTENG